MAGKHGRDQSRRNKAAAPVVGQAKPSPPVEERPESQPIWKRAVGGSIRWVGALVSAAVIAAVAAAVTVEVTRHVAVVQNIPARHGPPVKIDSVTVLRTDSQAGLYVFRRPVDLSHSDLQSLNQVRGNPAAYNAWFRSRGGVDPGSSNVQLVVEGNADQPARITDVTLAKSCLAPLDGTLFDNPPEAGQPALPINFNLDSPQSIAQAPDGHDYFPKSTIVLRPGEVQVIEATASTKLHYCQFSLQLTVLVGDHTTVETVVNNGKPFQVSALYKSVEHYHALYVGGTISPKPTGDFVRERPRPHLNG